MLIFCTPAFEAVVKLLGYTVPWPIPVGLILGLKNRYDQLNRLVNGAPPPPSPPGP